MGERTAEDWGRIAVSLPGWRWMRGMSIAENEHNREALVDYPPALMYVSEAGSDERGEVVDGEDWPDPDDPATAGCLLALAGAPHRLLPTVEAWIAGKPLDGITSLGRAVIADVRDQWGRWPGGEG